MSRVKRGVATRARHKKVIKMAKGFLGGRKNLFRRAKEAVIRASKFAYRDRRNRKRDFRRLWITRISAATRAEGMSYSQFAVGLRNAKILLNRKMLAELAAREPEIFKKVVAVVKK